MNETAPPVHSGPFSRSADLSTNSTSLRFELDPPYPQGIQIVEGEMSIKLGLGAYIVHSDCTTPPPPWNASFELLVTTSAGRTIASGTESGVFDDWVKEAPCGQYDFDYFSQSGPGIFPISIPEPVLVGADEGVSFNITLANPDAQHFVTLFFDDAGSIFHYDPAQATSISFPAELYSTALTISTSATNYRLGDSILIHGNLTNTWNNTGIGGQTIQLKALNVTWNGSSPAGNTILIASVTTSGSGDYSYEWRPQFMGSYQLWVSWTGTRYLAPSAFLNQTWVSIGRATTRLSVQVVLWVGLISNAYRIQGRLEGLNGPIAGANVLIYFQVPADSTSGTSAYRDNLITSARTDSGGYYSTVWTPQATGNFTIRATWDGSSSQQGQSAFAALNVTNLYLGWNISTMGLPLAGAAAGSLVLLRRRKKASIAP